MSSFERLWRWCRGRPALAGVTAALILVVLTGFGAVVALWLEAGASEARALQGKAVPWSDSIKPKQRSREADESHDKTLRLLGKFLRFVVQTPSDGPNQELPLALLQEIEVHLRELLQQRPSNPDVLFRACRGLRGAERASFHDTEPRGVLGLYPACGKNYGRSHNTRPKT